MSASIVDVEASNWKEEVLESENLVLVEFWSPQCPHCRMVAPIYTQLSKEYGGRLKFARLNIIDSQQNQELAVRLGVMGTPTFKFFCGGRPVQDIVGALPKDHLKQAIDFAINHHQKCLEKSTTPLYVR